MNDTVKEHWIGHWLFKDTEFFIYTFKKDYLIWIRDFMCVMCILGQKIKRECWIPGNQASDYCEEHVDAQKRNSLHEQQVYLISLNNQKSVYVQYIHVHRLLA